MKGEGIHEHEAGSSRLGRVQFRGRSDAVVLHCQAMFALPLAGRLEPNRYCAGFIARKPVFERVAEALVEDQRHQQQTALGHVERVD